MQFFQKHKLKFIILSILFLSGVLFFLIQNHNLDLNVFKAQASDETHNIRGWAWSQNIGWISMNCFNDYETDGEFENCCPGGDTQTCSELGIEIPDEGNYGLKYDGGPAGTNTIDGWAWSERLGWICFGTSCDGIPPFGRPKSWACVGKPLWNCVGGVDDGDTCGDDNQCEGGTCELTCIGDNGEDFYDTDSLVAHLKLNELGLNIGGCGSEEENCSPDASGSSNAAYLYPLEGGDPEPSLTIGRWGNAVSLDGIDDYMLVNDSNDLDLESKFTLEAFIKRSSLDGEQTILGKWDESTGKESYRLWIGDDNKLRFSVSDGENIATIKQRSICVSADQANPTVKECQSNDDCLSGICKYAPLSNANKWYHIVARHILTSDGEKTLSLFLDGERICTSKNCLISDPVPNTIQITDAPLYIGTKKSTDGSLDTHFAGAIDNVSIWDKFKFEKEIWNHANIEIDGWAKATLLEDEGWFKLRGFTKDHKAWGLHLNDYNDFYTISGYMTERHSRETADSNELISHWKLNRPYWKTNTTDQVIDSYGQNNGLVYNVESSEKGMFNGAAKFDGYSDGNESFIDCGPEGLGGDITIRAWVRSENVDSEAGFISKNNLIEEKVFSLGQGPEKGSIKFTVYNQGSPYYIETPAQTIQKDTWHHIVATYNGFYQTIYVDGQEVVVSEDWNFDIPFGISNYWLGRSGSNYFKGYLDNIAIWNRALTENEVKEDYKKRIPYSPGWAGGDHEYGGGSVPGEFNNFYLDNTSDCNTITANWDLSTWATSYTYFRDDNVDESACTGRRPGTEYSVLSGECGSNCSISDTELSPNTGYCYDVEAHNVNGDTLISDGPQWISTTLCSPGLISEIDDSICGELTLKWNYDDSADGYNIYRSFNSDDCSSDVNSDCNLVGHLGEGLDYDSDNDGNNDLIGHWKMNESSWNGTEGEIIDSSGQSNHGQAICGGDCLLAPAENNAKFEKAGDFSNTNDYLKFANIINPKNADFSLGAWVYPNSIGSEQTIISQLGGMEGTGTARTLLSLNSSGKFYSNLGGAATSSSTTAETNNWYNVVLTNSGNDVELFVNGQKEAENTVTVGESDGEMRIGIDYDNTDAFNGLIDNVYLSSIAKTGEEIRIDFEAGDCGGVDCSLSSELVCHIKDRDDGNCGTSQGDESICCFTDKRIIPFIDYYYNVTAVSESGESLPGDDSINSQTVCYPPTEEEEE